MRNFLFLVLISGLFCFLSCSENSGINTVEAEVYRIDRVSVEDPASGQVTDYTLMFYSDGSYLQQGGEEQALTSRDQLIKGRRVSPPTPNNDGGADYKCRKDDESICYLGQGEPL